MFISQALSRFKALQNHNELVLSIHDISKCEWKLNASIIAIESNCNISELQYKNISIINVN